MRKRLLVTATLTAGLLAAAAGAGGIGAAQAAPALAAASKPRPASAAWLYGVSATSRTNAWAVGAFDHADGFTTLIERWNGQTWKHVPTGLNIPENADSLTGIAATSAKSAWAAGTISSQYSFPMIDHWRGGKTWTQDDTPTPGGDGGAAYLTGVGAASSADAWAVGAYLPDLMATHTMILRWTGKKWIQVPSPSPGGDSSTSYSVLLGVAVLSPTDAWAVGRSSTGQPSAHMMTLIEHWNGQKWTTVPSPDPSRAGCVNDELTGVAASRAATWAVGDSCGAPLVLRLAGGQWRQVASPSPPAGVSAQLASVTVTSAANAWAVGHVGGKVLILHWNGAKWATASAPSPAGAKPALLTGVSAVSSSVAWAVGEADYPRNVRKLLIERWDGTRWKLAPVPNPTP
jgi:hypothetical protein